MQDFENKMLTLLDLGDGVPLEKASVRQLYHAASKAAMSQAAPRWKEKKASKRACYLSAEFSVSFFCIFYSFKKCLFCYFY